MEDAFHLPQVHPGEKALIMKLEPRFPGLARAIDLRRKLIWEEAVKLKNVKNLWVVCGFISVYEDDVVAECGKCGREVSVRGWLKREAEKHDIPIFCIECAVKMDPESRVI